MLTPIEIHSKVFRGSGMGYQKADVDAFFQTVAASYEEVYKENMALKEKIASMSESLSQYKEIEKSLQKALVLAETTAEETVVSAKKNATVIEQEAVLKAQSIVADAKVELEHLQTQMTELVRSYDQYKAQYRALAQAQIEFLNSEAFNFESHTASQMENLSRSADEHADQLDAVMVNTETGYGAQAREEAQVEQEDDFDETMSTDDTLIKDFNEIFDQENASVQADE